MAFAYRWSPSATSKMRTTDVNVTLADDNIDARVRCPHPSGSFSWAVSLYDIFGIVIVDVVTGWQYSCDVAMSALSQNSQTCVRTTHIGYKTMSNGVINFLNKHVNVPMPGVLCI